MVETLRRTQVFWDTPQYVYYSEQHTPVGLETPFEIHLKRLLRKVNLLLVDLKPGGLLSAESILWGPQFGKGWKTVLQNQIEVGQQVLIKYVSSNSLCTLMVNLLSGFGQKRKGEGEISEK